MKKIVFFSSLLILPFLTFSQTENVAKMPSKSDVMIEINFNPFGEKTIFSFDNLQSKYWFSDKAAVRLGFEVDYKNNSIKTDDYPSYTEYKNTTAEQSLMLGIKPGIEFRILTNSKISPYVGAEFSYRNKTASSEYVDFDRDYDYQIDDYVYYPVTTTVNGGWRGTEQIKVYDYYDGTFYYYNVPTMNKERSFNSYGANLLLGADLFVVRNFYLGFEIGIGYEMINYKQVHVKLENDNQSGQIEKSSLPSERTFDFGFYYNNSFRIGVYF